MSTQIGMREGEKPWTTSRAIIFQRQILQEMTAEYNEQLHRLGNITAVGIIGLNQVEGNDVLEEIRGNDELLSYIRVIAPSFLANIGKMGREIDSRLPLGQTSRVSREVGDPQIVQELVKMGIVPKRLLDEGFIHAQTPFERERLNPNKEKLSHKLDKLRPILEIPRTKAMLTVLEDPDYPLPELIKDLGETSEERPMNNPQASWSLYNAAMNLLFGTKVYGIDRSQKESLGKELMDYLNRVEISVEELSSYFDIICGNFGSERTFKSFTSLLVTVDKILRGHDILKADSKEQSENLGGLKLARRLLLAHRLGMSADYLISRVSNKKNRNRQKEEAEIRSFYENIEKDQRLRSELYILNIASTQTQEDDDNLIFPEVRTTNGDFKSLPYQPKLQLVLGTEKKNPYEIGDASKVEIEKNWKRRSRQADLRDLIGRLKSVDSKFQGTKEEDFDRVFPIENLFKIVPELGQEGVLEDIISQFGEILGVEGSSLEKVSFFQAYLLRSLLKHRKTFDSYFQLNAFRETFAGVLYNEIEEYIDLN